MFKIFVVLVVRTITFARYIPTLLRFTPVTISSMPRSLSRFILIATDGWDNFTFFAISSWEIS